MPIYQQIKKDGQIKKFCMYGFFKNLKFFAPYLLLYMLDMDLNLFQIGVMFSIREGIIYIFEIPSGIIADAYGKKKELLLCFTFYIISFVCLFFAANLWMMTLGMIFFGLGDAFRSGTHKAMILSYLEHKKWYEHKGFVYGRTRSFSLLGSSLSAFISIYLVLNLPSLRWVFLASTIPYVLDFLLILSYPKFLDEKRSTEFTIKSFFGIGKNHLASIFKNPNLMKVLGSSSTYNGVFKTIKDYIQPILSILIVAAGVGTFAGYNTTDSLNIYLGLIYGVFYIFSSLVSKNIFRITSKWQARPIFDLLMDIMGIALILLSLAIGKEYMYVGIIIYFIIYLMMDARRPVFVDVCGDMMDAKQRTTVLSVESQMKALLMIVIGPLFGWIGDSFSIASLFMGIGISLVIMNRFLKK